MKEPATPQPEIPQPEIPQPEIPQPETPQSAALLPDGDAARSEPRSGSRRRELEPLSPLTRILIMVLGWLLILVGILGLVLPGIQGILTLMLGAACISLVDPRALRLLRKIFARWPKGWRMLLRLRQKMHRWLAE